MDLNQIVTVHERGFVAGKHQARRPGFSNRPNARRNYYYDIFYSRGLKGKGLSDYDVLYECVYNRHRHLWLMSATLAGIATKRLDAAKILSTAYASFEDLYDAIRAAIGGLKGIGDVALYDIAVRIGFYLGVYPCDYVYYHSYLKESARELLGVKRLKSFRAPVSDFRSVFSNMPAIFIEDILCSMHARICPTSKKYAHLKGSPDYPLTKFGSFSFGKLPVSSTLNFQYFLKP